MVISQTKILYTSIRLPNTHFVLEVAVNLVKATLLVVEFEHWMILANC